MKMREKKIIMILFCLILQDLPRKASVMEVKRNGGAFQPFQREKSVAKPNGSVKVPPSAPATSSTSGPVTGGSGGLSIKREDKEGQRKQRRNWSPELHRRFLNALQQLGGSHGIVLLKSYFLF